MLHATRRHQVTFFGTRPVGLAGAALFAAMATGFSMPVVHATDNPLDAFPVVIQCHYKNTTHAFYLSRVTDDGLATYTASDRIAGTISLDGHAKAVGGEGGGTCVGKTLDELRASGQAYDLKPR